MLSRYFFTLVFLLLSVGLMAQSNWQSAVITTADGEQLVGKIDDRRWGFRIRQLRFKPAGSQEVQRLFIPDLKSFTVADRQYFVRDLAVNSSPRATLDLVKPERRSVEQSPKAIMLLLEGPVSLFSYVDEQSNTHFFAQKRGGEVTYLEFGRYLLDQEYSKTYYTEPDVFRDQLIDLLRDCPKLELEISRVKYRQEPLIKLFERYYACSNERATYELPRTEGGWSFGVDAGVVRSTPDYGEIEPGAIFFSGLSSTDPAAGAHLTYRFSGLSGDVAVRLGVWYESFEVTKSVPLAESSSPTVTSSQEYFFNERSIHFQLGPEAILVRSRFPVVLETAAHYHRILDYRESRFNQRIENGMITTTGLAYDFANSNAFSLSFGAGIIIGPGRITLRASATRRVYDTFVLNLYRVGVIGSYEF